MKEVEGKPKINHVTVFERPGLEEFLQEVSKFADLVLFTAGLEGLNPISNLHHVVSVFLGFVPCCNYDIFFKAMLDHSLIELMSRIGSSFVCIGLQL